MSDVGVAPRLGLAHGPAALQVLDIDRDLIDFIEIPYEHLRHDPSSYDALDGMPVILHCASMSVAGFVEPDDDTLTDIRAWADRLATPWIGEHLAYILADDPDALAAGREGEPIRMTYTLAPQLSGRVVDRVGENLARVRAHFDQQIILENSPHYLDVPGSEMSHVDFICEVVERFDVGLLLDLTHFAISACNAGFDLAAGLRVLPLDKVVEIHLSGLSMQDGVAWDDHARLAPPALLEHLGTVLESSSPRAITLEYNWAPDHRPADLLGQLDEVRAIIGSEPSRAD
jgi:uncharacterized protein (UPF0276 family)